MRSSPAWRGPGGGACCRNEVEQELDAEIVDGAAEEDGRHVAGQDGLFIERFAGGIEHLQFLDEGLERIGRHAVADLRDR